MKYIFIILTTIFFSKIASSQGTYTPVDDLELTGGEAIPPAFERNKFNWFWSTSSFAVFTFANIWQQRVTNEILIAQHERDIEAASSQLAILKNSYDSQEKYPALIVDGWHKAMATDNLNFCKEIKVLVKSNKVNKAVIDNCIPLNATAFGSIKNGKTSISINAGEQTMLADVYFIFDLEEPMIVSEPVRPGYISFWTNIENFETAEIYMNGKRISSFTSKFDSEPDCFTSGMSSAILAPGTYYFKVERRGSDWDGSVEIKSGMCLKYLLKEVEQTRRPGPPRPGGR
jgi:hypothetical protein